MEQHQLRAFEKKCIQGEPAYCSAACPFHVDVKMFIDFMSKKDIDNAFKIIEKTLPLPEILGRICDHPCQAHCIRKDIDAPVAIGALERICVNNRSKQKKRFQLSPKEKNVGILGSGLSGLVVAWELIFKGYGVTVYEQDHTIGGYLLSLSETILPSEILTQEMKKLESYGVIFKTEISINESFLRGLIKEFDAVYLGSDSSMTTNLAIIEKFGFLDNNKFFSETHTYTKFDDLDLNSKNNYSYPVAYAAEGRKVATSIDRFLSNVSITAGREKEGVFKTRLITDKSKIEYKTPIILEILSEKSYNLVNDLISVSKEAERCVQCDCSRCVRACKYIQSFKGYPCRYAREIYNNSAIVIGEKKANLLINSCSLCNLCETVCPNDFSMANLCLMARQEMVEKGKMPVSTHEFALNEMAWASGEECFIALHEPEHNYSTQIFFPGCQFIGSAPFQVKKIYDFLRKTLSGGTGFVSGCCGAPAKWSGRESMFIENLQPFKKFWESSGKPLIITACTSCSLMLAKGIEDAKIISIYEQMVNIIENQKNDSLLINKLSQYSKRLEKKIEKTTLESLSNNDLSNNDLNYRLSLDIDKTVSIVDPCTARDNFEVQEAVRKLVRLAGIKISEISASRHLTECCGFGGVVYNANPSLSKEIIKQRVEQSDNDFIAYCAMCRDRLASTGKKISHVLDLFWSEADYPEKRKDPGFSKRHDNLAMAKQMMLQDIWNQKNMPMKILNAKIDDNCDNSKPIEEHSEIIISSEVKRILEERFILRADIQKVIDHFESGVNTKYFMNPEKNSLIAFYRPKNVCFWIEFQKNKRKKKYCGQSTSDRFVIECESTNTKKSENREETKIYYEILNSWCHRMEVVSNNQFVLATPTYQHEENIICAICNEPLNFYKNHVSYLGNSFDVGLPQCKNCGAIFISYSLANGKMAEVEKILEDK